MVQFVKGVHIKDRVSVKCRFIKIDFSLMFLVTLCNEAQFVSGYCMPSSFPITNISHSPRHNKAITHCFIKAIVRVMIQNDCYDIKKGMES